MQGSCRNPSTRKCLDQARNHMSGAHDAMAGIDVAGAKPAPHKRKRQPTISILCSIVFNHTGAMLWVPVPHPKRRPPVAPAVALDTSIRLSMAGADSSRLILCPEKCKSVPPNGFSILISKQLAPAQETRNVAAKRASDPWRSSCGETEGDRNPHG